ncbi:MAG: ABC transporter permease [Candidatus Omnitrophica bacterium]|nr:ABC transporter permease [Candidatus Omnitrophota bacterium]
MLKLIIRRLLIAIPQLIGISLITFALIQLTPGNFFDTLKLDPQISQQTIERYEKLYRLNSPFWEQYGAWLWNFIQGDLGHSFFYNVPVAKIISSRLFNTFILSLAGFLFTWSVALPLGVWAAVRRNRLSDRLVQFFSHMALSSPSFLYAMLLLFIFSRIGGLPLGGMHSAHYDDLSFLGKSFDLLRHLVIPMLAISIGSIGALQRIMRGNMLEVMRQQYVLTARAKGLPENCVIYKHALRNAINPMVTLLGYEFSALLSGAALVEIIYSWPGLGSLMLTAVRSKDLYLVMASMMMGGILILIGNLLADILLAFVDPRIRYD